MYDRVLEKCSWGPGKVVEIFLTKRVGTLTVSDVCINSYISYVVNIICIPGLFFVSIPVHAACEAVFLDSVDQICFLCILLLSPEVEQIEPHCHVASSSFPILVYIFFAVAVSILRNFLSYTCQCLTDK